MQRHESELARVTRRAGHQDPSRFEQGPELGIGRRGTCAGRAALGAIGRRRQFDERVDGDDDTVGADDQRVDVDARHIGAFGGESAETDQHRGERVTFDGRFTAELTEQLLRGEAVDHVERRRRRDRRGAEHDVGHRLGEDAADPEHDGRSELRVAHHACDQFPVAADHRCHEHIDVTVVGCRRREQIGCGAFDAGPIAEPEPHETALGLVGDRVAVQLGHDRITDLVSRLSRFGRARREPLGARWARRTTRATPSIPARTASSTRSGPRWTKGWVTFTIAQTVPASASPTVAQSLRQSRAPVNRVPVTPGCAPRPGSAPRRRTR